MFPGIYGEDNPLNTVFHTRVVKEVGIWSHWNLGGGDGETGLYSLEKLPFRLLGLSSVLGI